MDITLGRSIADADAGEWDALVTEDHPFAEHGFLALLEESRSVGPRTGWMPAPVLVRDRGRLIGAAPAYVRSDSYGEYIFDWGWAEAASRAGLRYYPKVTIAVPFTPATGPRLLIHPEAQAPAVTKALLDGVEQLRAGAGASGVHVLCCLDREAALLEGAGYLRRATHQYHWRNDGYSTFDDFLGALRSESRKQIRKERRRIGEQGVSVIVKQGLDVTEDDWRTLDRLYRAHASEKWGRPYLTPQFFARARDVVGHRAVVAFGLRDGRIIAGTLSFERGAALYGRYWGALEEVDGLHFELCYYALIEHAIRTKKRLFEAGAQGDHKLKRGFVPVAVHSAHQLVDTDLRAAVARFVAGERRALGEALPEWANHGPFRAGAAPDFPAIAGTAVGRHSPD